MTKITWQRTDHLPEGVDAEYHSVSDDDVLILIRPDLITHEGALVISDLCTKAVRRYWQPKHRLRVIDGGRCDEASG